MDGEEPQERGGEEDIDLSGRGINKMKRGNAIIACRKLGLSVDGNVKDLKSRLREYTKEEETHICNSCGRIKPSFGRNVDPKLLKYAEWNLSDNGSFLKMNGALFTKPIETRIRLFGTSLGLTFPKAIMEYLDLKADDAIKLIIIPDPERDERR